MIVVAKCVVVGLGNTGQDESYPYNRGHCYYAKIITSRIMWPLHYKLRLMTDSKIHTNRSPDHSQALSSRVRLVFTDLSF